MKRSSLMNSRVAALLFCGVVVLGATAAGVGQGRVALHTWRTAAEFKDIVVTGMDGRVLWSGLPDPAACDREAAGTWERRDGVLRQTNVDAEETALRFGDVSWRDYTVRCQARKLAGSEGFILHVREQTPQQCVYANFGGWSNKRHGIETRGDYELTTWLTRASAPIETNRWYALEVSVAGEAVQMKIDGETVFDHVKLRERRPMRRFNPMIPGMFADPSIVKFGDTWYAYCTTDVDRGLDQAGEPVVWTSKDFVNWSFKGSLLAPGFDFHHRVQGGFWRYWAPSKAILKDGKYRLYPTIVPPRGGNGAIGAGTMAMVADRPEGPFVMVNGTNDPSAFASAPRIAPDIDGDLLVEGDAAYVFWRRGQAQALDETWTKRVGPKTVMPVRPGYSEGPIVFARKGFYYYLYTKNGGPNYSYAYLMRKEGPLGTWTAPKEDFVLVSDVEEGVIGPGHGNVWHDEVNDQWYFNYLEFGEDSTTRRVCCNRMAFNDDGTIRPIKVDWKGVGYLGPNQEPRRNLAPLATFSASSERRPRLRSFSTETCPQAPTRTSAVSCQRVCSYVAGWANDEWNFTCWRPAPTDQTPWLACTFAEPVVVHTCKVYFRLPTEPLAWRLEASDDGTVWRPVATGDNAVIHSPHVIELPGLKVKALRLSIEGARDPGVFEWQVFE